MPDILTDMTTEYLTAMEPPADDLVMEMETHATEDGIPIADRSVAGLQAIFARSTGADRALEFGTAIGYSTLFVARSGTDVITTEVDDDRIDAAVDYLERDGIEVRVTEDAATIESTPTGTGTVTVLRGPALEHLPTLAGPFDLVFLDAIKQEYEDYLAGSIPLMPPNGIIVADNLLRGGRVALEEVEDEFESSVNAIRSFNETFIGHDKLDTIITPQGDGTGIGVKTAE